VLIAMGVPPEQALSSVRLSLSKYSTDAEVDHLLETLPPIIEKLRGASPKASTAATQEISQ
jgi:cysteine desulfurase